MLEARVAQLEVELAARAAAAPPPAAAPPLAAAPSPGAAGRLAGSGRHHAPRRRRPARRRRPTAAAAGLARPPHRVRAADPGRDARAPARHELVVDNRRRASASGARKSAGSAERAVWASMIGGVPECTFDGHCPPLESPESGEAAE